MRKKIASFLSVTLLTSILTLIFGVPAAKAAGISGCADGAGVTSSLTVVASHGQAFYIDSGVTPKLDAGYVGYRITNNSASTKKGLWVSLTNFTGGKIDLANPSDQYMPLDDIATTSTKTAYFLLKASGASLSAQSHLVSIYDRRPDLAGAILQRSCTYTFSAVKETIKAAANTVGDNSGSANGAVWQSASNLSLGQTFTLTVEGQTGNIGAGSTPDNDSIWLTPAAISSWPTSAFRLKSVTALFDANDSRWATSPQYTDQLLITGANGLTEVDQGYYLFTYTFEVIGKPASSVTAVPVAQIASGTQMKHTDTSTSSTNLTFGTFSIPETLAKTVTSSSGLEVATVSNYSYLSPGITYVAVPYKLEVSTTAASSTIDEIVDTPGVGAIYYSGSGLVTDNNKTSQAINAIYVGSESNLSPRPYHFVGPFQATNVPKKVTITYKMWLPVGGSYTNNAYALVGSQKVGSSATAIPNVAVSTVGSSGGTVSATTGTTTLSVVATTEAASGVTNNAAVLNATVDPNGTPSTLKFQYGTNSSLSSGTTTSTSSVVSPVTNPSSSSDPVSTTLSLSGLAEGTTYYYRIIAYDSSGAVLAQGNILSFTTLITASTPTVTTLAASSITTNAATLNGSVSPNNTTINRLFFQYNSGATLSGAPTQVTLQDSTPADITTAGTDLQYFSTNLTGLASGTYSYRFGICTTTSSGSGVCGTSGNAIYGSTLTFSTALQNQTITFNTISNKTYGAAPFTQTTSATSSLQVAVTSQTTSICTITTSYSSPNTTITITPLNAGDCTLQATQAGNGTYNPATPVSQTFNIAPAVLTLTADNKTITLPASTPSFTSTLTGFKTVNGSTDAATVTSATYTFSGSTGYSYGPSITAPTTAGIYTNTPSAGSINFTSGTANNYTVQYATGTYTINAAAKSDQTVVLDDGSLLAGGTLDLNTKISNPGTGTGAFTFQVTTGTCTVDGATLTGAGTSCVVTMTKAGDSTTNSATDTGTYTVVAPYTVTFDPNGASGSPTDASLPQTSIGGSVTLTSVGSMVKTNSGFMGWATAASNGTLLAAGSSYTPASNITLYAQWATTGAASPVGSSTATIAGSASLPLTSPKFCYATTNPGSTFDASTCTYKAATGTYSGYSYSWTSGLANNTTYYYQLTGTVGGTSYYGTVRTFTTSSLTAWTITAVDATYTVGGTVPVLSGSASPSAGLSGSLTCRAYTSADTGFATPKTIDATLSAATYVIHCTGTAASGYSATPTYNDAQLVVSAAPTPVTTDASSITTSTATLNGTMNANGASTTVSFQYCAYAAGTCDATHMAASPSTASAGTATGSSVTNVSASISVSAGTTYYFRVKGVSGGATVYGDILSFTALATWTITATAASYTVGGAVPGLTGTVNPGGAIAGDLTCYAYTDNSYGTQKTIDTNLAAGTYVIHCTGTAASGYASSPSTNTDANLVVTSATYTVTFYDNYTTPLYRSTTQSSTTSTSLTTISSIGWTRTGYTFGGWATTSARATAGTSTYGNGDPYDFAADKDLYAIWTPNSHTFAYNGNSSDGGSTPTGGGSKNYASTITAEANTYTRDGYHFVNWNTQSGGGGTSYSPTDTFAMPDENVTLYAQWTGNQFVYSGNTATIGSTSSQTYSGSPITARTNGFTAPSGYTFGGWCLTQPALGDTCGGTTYDETTGILPVPSSSMTYVYAIWIGDPTATTSTLTSGDFTATSIVLHGKGNAKNNANTPLGFYKYGTASDLSGTTVSTTAKSAKTNSANTDVDLQDETISSGINTSTIYYYQAGVTAGGKTKYGAIKSILTLPTTPTNPVLSLDGTNGTLSFDSQSKGSNVIITYTYSCTSLTGSTVSGSSTSTSIALTGFTAGATYTCSVNATSSASVSIDQGGGSSNNASASAQTVKSAPVATTDTPGTITSTSVVLKGHAHPHGNNGGTGQFVFGTSSTLASGNTNYPSTAQSYSDGTDSDSTITDQTVSGLTEATIYYYKATAGATHQNTSSGSIHAVLTLPAAPTLNSLTISGTSASLSFTPVTAGTNVTIIYTGVCTPDGSATTFTATSSTSPLSISGLASGTNYSCVVYATSSYTSTPTNNHGGGNGNNSGAKTGATDVSTDPEGITDDPTSVSDVSFTMQGRAHAHGNSGSYGLFQWGTTAGLPSSTSTSNQNITDLTSTLNLSGVPVSASQSTIYYYRAVGTNGSKTSQGAIHVVLTKPSQPSSVTVSLDGTTGVVSFPTQTKGSGVTVTYYVSCSGTGGTTVTATGTDSSYTIEGFTPGVTYTCTVYGSSSPTDPTVVAFGGGSGSSNSGNGTVKSAPVATTDSPGTIDSNSVVLKGKAHPHGNNGGTGQFKFGTDETLNSGTSNYPTSAQSYSNGTDTDSTITDQTVTGLDSATIYYYQAIAGATNHSSSRGAIHAVLTTPAAPTGLNATVSGTSVTITFDPVSAGRGVNITYTAVCTAGGVTTTSTATSLTSITFSGLTPSTTYSCVVYATASYGSSIANSHGGGNSSNSSGASASIAATTDPAAETDAPTSISATSFTMHGKADSGSEVSGTGNYEWSTESNLDSVTPTSVGSDSISTTQSPLSGTAVSASSATIYYYRAIGNAGGKKGKGLTKSVLTLPAAPTSVDLTLDGTNGTLTFIAPSTGPNVALTYSISCTSSDGGTTVTSSGSTTTYNLTGFTPGKTYVCSVTPSSAASGVTVNYGGGNGNPGSHSGKSVKAAPVATTDAPNESDITSTSFKISGHAHPHGNNGGTGQLTWSTADDLSVSPTNVPSSAQSYTDGTDSDSSISTQTVNSLTPATIYYYRANAGATNQSTSHGAIHAILTKPATPTGLNATVSGTSITVSFTGSTPGTNVSISYTLSCTPSGGGSATTATGSASPLTVTGLTAGTTYNCVVYATASYITTPSNQHGGGNGSSSSAVSKSISATTDPTGVTDDPTLITSESFTMNGQADSGTDATGDGNYEFDTDSTFGTSVDKGPKSITSTRSALDATSVTGLTSATIYYYRAVGKSGAKRGNGVTRAVLLLPSAPTLNSITISGTTASAAFTTVSGGTNVTISYTVTCTPTGGGTAVTATGTTSPISVSGLASGTTYDCNVYATSAYLSAPSNSHGGGNSSRSGNQSGTTGSSSSPRRSTPSTPTTTPTPPVTPTTPTTPLIPNIPGPQGSGNQLTTANQGLVPNTNVAVVQTFANTYPAGINVTVPVLQVITAPIPPVEKVTQVIVNGNSTDPIFVNGGVKINGIIGPKDKVILQVTDGAAVKEIPVAYTARPISLANVNFNLGSAGLTSKAKKILDTVAKVMIEHGFTYLDLSGHTDVQGGATYDNKKLSENRSAAVKAYLEKKLGKTVQVVTSAHSYAEPAVKGNTIAAHATNRRVQVVVK